MSLSKITQTKNTDLVIFLKPRLLKVLERASLFLKVYRSGKLPKIVRILPSVRNFEEIIWLTRPDIWSDQAVLSITRSFLPRLDKAQMSRYYSLILAPRFQESIFNQQISSNHIQKAIKLSTKFPFTFFSSLILPICDSKECSLKEAAVLGSILYKYHFSSLVIMTLIIRLLDNPITQTKCLMLRIIISKNYLIPHRILDLFVDFFTSNNKKIFSPHYRTLLIIFLRNYTSFLSNEDKQRIHNFKQFKKKTIIP